ncbi:Replication protein A DNA-binding subunit B [Zea mays]|uniref:Replication protein A DNA-binding subunit B n=1 Tax=Zea mays TaxID=4577 RepID=A0A3L6FV58_MAIZE|nr:Replication protein A DNA-binding subunit B [Zea mays]
MDLEPGTMDSVRLDPFGQIFHPGSDVFPSIFELITTLYQATSFHFTIGNLAKAALGESKKSDNALMNVKIDDQKLAIGTLSVDKNHTYNLIWFSIKTMKLLASCLQVKNLKALLEVETREPLRQQQIHFNGKEVEHREAHCRWVPPVKGALAVLPSVCVSLSTIGRSTLEINPDLPKAKNLMSWYVSEGKDTSLAPISAEAGATRAGGFKSMYSDRVFLSHITSDPAMGQEKPVFFSLYAIISHIKPDQNMWYRACTTCNKVIEVFGSGYWCEGCQKNDYECSLRYIMVIKVSDPTSEAWVSVFNEHAEKIIGCSADELDRIRKEEGDDNYVLKLKEATWVPHLFRISVTQDEYMNEMRQRITVRGEAPVDFAAESKYLLEEITKLTAC